MDNFKPFFSFFHRSLSIPAIEGILTAASMVFATQFVNAFAGLYHFTNLPFFAGVTATFSNFWC